MAVGGSVVRTNEPKIVLGEDGTPLIMSALDAGSSVKDDGSPAPEEDADREKRELAISAKLWAKARRTGPPRKMDMNPIIIKTGRFIDQEECHKACRWFVEQGELSQGAWLHKYPKWTKWGHEVGREKREVVERDQMVMRILRNYSAKEGPTAEEQDEALTLYKRIQTERTEESQKRKRGFLSIETSRQTSVDVGGMMPSKTMPGVDVPLGWNEEEGEMGTRDAYEADSKLLDEQKEEAEEEQQEADKEENREVDYDADESTAASKAKRKKR